MTRTDPGRRRFLAGSVALPVALGGAASASPADNVAADLRRYLDFGGKASGGPGDQACGAWLEAELRHAGYATERQSISVPWFEPERSELRCGEARASVWPQPVVVPTGPDGVTGPLVRVDAAGQAAAPLAGAIALIDLPAARWSSILARPVRGPVDAAFAAGALAAVVITNGPTGQVIALNTTGDAPMFARPVALLAPSDAAPMLGAAMRGERATLCVTGSGGRRPAFNLIGRRDRGKGRWVMISTPRSGWFGCAGERGGGVAAWLALARWAAAALPDADLAFLCNSGHEYEYLGAEQALHTIVPKPAETAFWLHLGANFAARDWHEITGKLMPLPGTDSQRYLVVSRPLLQAAGAAFAGHAGFEAPYAVEELAAGEIAGIAAAGYGPVAGIFGIHRFHHTQGDDARCVSPEAVAATISPFKRLLAGIAGRARRS